MEELDQNSKLPLGVLLASLAAYLALAITGQGYGILTLCSVGLLLSQLFSARLNSDSWAVWMLRVLVFGAVALANVIEPARSAGHGIYPRHYVHAFGQLCAAELVIQSWLLKPAGGRHVAVALLLSGFVFLSACNTFMEYHIKYITPVYMLMLGLSFRTMRPGIEGKSSKVSMGRWAMISYASMFVAVFMGAFLSFSIFKYKADILEMVQDLDLRFLNRSKVGFSDSPRLGSGSGMKRSLTRVLSIEGAYPGAYLHGMAFETYENSRWLPPIRRREVEIVEAKDFDAPIPGAPSQITRLVDAFHILFAPIHCGGLSQDRMKQIEQDKIDRAMLQVKVPAPFLYTVIAGSNGTHQGPLCEPITMAQRARCSVVPGSIERGVWMLARKIAGDKKTPQEKIFAVESYLQLNHAYSLDVELGEGEPISDFLLNKRAAHCEFFAAGACMLLRCVGVPTRYTVGYFAHESSGPDAWVVRQQDAHAWAESWVDGVGWVTLDGTPADTGRPDFTSASIPFYLAAWEWINDLALDLGDWLYELSWVQLGLLLSSIVGGLIALLWLREILMRRLKRTRVPVFEYETIGEAWDWIHVHFEGFLKNKGVPCPANLPWKEHLKSAGECVPELFSEVEWKMVNEFIDEYRSVRFSDPKNTNALQELAKRLKSLEVLKS